MSNAPPHITMTSRNRAPRNEPEPMLSQKIIGVVLQFEVPLPHPAAVACSTPVGLRPYSSLTPFSSRLTISLASLAFDLPCRMSLHARGPRADAQLEKRLPSNRNWRRRRMRCSSLAAAHPSADTPIRVV